MPAKEIKARVQHKHDIETNWLESSFVPLQSEFIVYDIDEAEVGE